MYYIPEGYVPILIKKNLFINADKAVEKFDNINIPLYVLDDFELNIKKPPNPFLIFRSEIYKNTKNEHPKSTSRELSKIIGNIWNKMTKENKLPYINKANEIKKKHKKLYPRHKYKKVMNNLKRREYIIRKEINNNPQRLLIKNFLNEIIH